MEFAAVFVRALLALRRQTTFVFWLTVAFTSLGPVLGRTQAQHQSASAVVLQAQGIQFRMELSGGRYGFLRNGERAVAPDATAGVLLSGSPVTFRPDGACTDTFCELSGVSAGGGHVQLTVRLTPNRAELTAIAEHSGEEVRFVTAGAAPGFGLADHAVLPRSARPLKQYDTDISGFADDEFLSGQDLARLVSNFVIYPQRSFAELLVDPWTKIVHSSAEQIVQGVVHAAGPVRLFYFFGNTHQIYAQYLAVRNAMGYRVFAPKYRAFGVGWEAFGALGWDTNQQTVEHSVDQYIAQGYPLRWAVIGSGFWPANPEMHETTNFGLWNREKYPDPAALIAHFRSEQLVVMLGLRITFITTGPFAAEGVARDYFLKAEGQPQVFHGAWPQLPYYLLDAHNPAALDWYMRQVQRWGAFGIGGYKEDFFDYGGHGLRDDKVDPVNDRLMDQGQLVIERNGYLSSNGDLHRIDDFNHDENQDRGPVNALALAYSGFPLVYPDIVGGLFAKNLSGEAHLSSTRSPEMELYMMREAQWAALCPGMAMGEPPWTFSAQTAKVTLQAAQLHDRIAPYLYSNAVRFAHDGYPWTMTPLPIAFPQDSNVYGRENAAQRGYEWMIGDALLATPLYGNDYATATTRDIYLPPGQWMDFDTGQLYPGSQTLEKFSLPPGKAPLFVGGSGVTLENRDGRLVISIYPVATHATAHLTLPQGNRTVQVRVQGLAAGAPWSGVDVRDRSGNAVHAFQSKFSFVFAPRPGERYSVRALP